jgi:hypothetical protein
LEADQQTLWRYTVSQLSVATYEITTWDGKAVTRALLESRDEVSKHIAVVLPVNVYHVSKVEAGDEGGARVKTFEGEFEKHRNGTVARASEPRERE